jgi:periplasmic protein TonB
MKSRTVAVSFAAHALLLLLLAVSLRYTPRVEHTLRPGTALGNTMLTYYAPGSSAPDGGVPPRPVKLPSPKPVPQVAVAPTAPDKPGTVAANHGIGNSQESGLGEGDISIALGTYFPRPQPSLSTMSPGSSGDVVLDAVIGEDGRISKLTVVKSLGDAIDKVVIATVQTWTYTPAKRNGTPVPSEQEISFHYERG